MVYASEMRYLKVTVTPDESEVAVNPNKSRCMFLYCDGTFKVLGTTHKSYRVCSLLRSTILKAHSSSMCPAIIGLLEYAAAPRS